MQFTRCVLYTVSHMHSLSIIWREAYETNFTSVWFAVNKKIETITPEFSSFLTEGNVKEEHFKISIYADKNRDIWFFFFPFQVEQGVLKFNFIQD